ncbi:MAG: T9SS type A sorting domain-containing protein [Flavobacteriales bacterium]|nr:T9SS type A sorting domain-containing protein [Flavobacteriales bacterium]
MNCLEKLSVFPNPTNERAVVLWQQATAGVSQLRVSDINGQIVWEEQQRSHIGTNAKVLETASWSAGMYMVQITSNGMRQSTKLLKVH